jgi:hypothetical protein
MPMSGASMFWLDTLHGCNLDQSIPLPYDRYRLSNEYRTSRTISISFNFDQDLSHHFLTYSSSNKIKPQHLVFAIYYVFLFKLTNGESDLCIGMTIDNRYRDELKSIIGLFENVIPLRCQLDPDWPFDQLINYVYEMITNNMKYSYFPLQRILNQHPNISKPAFLDISFAFQSNESENNKNEVIIGVSRIHPMPISLNMNKHKSRDK